MFLLQNSFLIWAIIVLAKVKWRRLVVSMWTASLRRREWPVTKSKATCCRRGWVNQYSEVLDRAFCIHQLRIWWSIQTLDFLFSVMQQPKSGLGRHAGKVSKPSTITHTHTHTHTHTRYSSSETKSRSSQWPLPIQHTTNKRHEHPCLHRGSNPRYPQSRGCRPMP